MIQHKESHVDHVSSAVLAFALAHFAGRKAAFRETIQLPDGMTATCGVYGPSVGDDPVNEEIVVYEKRNGRNWPSRLVDRPTREVNMLTVIAGPYDGHPCVLYTLYGGPLAPRELNDPSLPEQDREEAETFWKSHALSR